MGVTLYTTGDSEKDNCRRCVVGLLGDDFFKMLLEELELTYA
jgi:hypothetical protein